MQAVEVDDSCQGYIEYAMMRDDVANSSTLSDDKEKRLYVADVSTALLRLIDPSQ